MNWEFISEANLQLTETEHRYYGDIFLYCCEHSDNDSVPVVKAAELLRSANLPRDVTVKILDICAGPKGSSHLGRKQFYAALKLVAAHQAGVDIHRETAAPLVITTALPRFTWSSSEDEEGRRSLDCSRTMKKGRSGSRLPESTTESESEAESPRETGGSTDSPTPTNSVTQERNEGIPLGDETILDSVAGSWQGLLVSEEQRQLLGTEEESSERHSSDEADGEADEGAGGGFPPDEVWVISDEQREYYAAQFAKLQPDPEGLLAGSLARTFFEKSSLPVAELRRIWQLADVTRDGALSLQEFYVAMHLVVVRRNHVPLPDVLPPSLAIPAITAATAATTTTTTTTMTTTMMTTMMSTSTTMTSTTTTATTTTTTTIMTTMTTTTTTVPPPPPPTVLPSGTTAFVSQTAKWTREKSKEWTKFVDSPTGTSGSLTSPGPKPVNFDFQKAAVERDPKILHPVPLRLTPEAAILASSANGATTTTTTTTTTSGTNGIVTHVDEDSQHSAVTLVQRPLAKKPPPLQQPDDGIIVTPKKEPPPPPPPRPYRTHTRSSSLDLNKLAKIGQNFLGAPPLVPPRVSPGITSPRKLVGQKSEGEQSHGTTSESQGFVADFSHFSPKGEIPENQMTTVEANTPQSQQFAGVCGAFHIYRKPSPKRGEGEDENVKNETEEERPLTLQELRDKNSELRLVCEELTRELAGALQERINLQAKLLLINYS